MERQLRGVNINGDIQLEEKIKDISAAHEKEMEEKKNHHSNEASALKNRIKALEKDNSELQHRCEKLEMSVNFEKEKKNEQKKLYEERIKDKSSLITDLQDRRQHLSYGMKGDPWYKKDSRKKTTSRNSQSPSDEATDREKSKKISNDQELIQSDPTSCPQNQKGNN